MGKRTEPWLQLGMPTMMLIGTNPKSMSTHTEVIAEGSVLESLMVVVGYKQASLHDASHARNMA